MIFLCFSKHAGRTSDGYFILSTEIQTDRKENINKCKTETILEEKINVIFVTGGGEKSVEVQLLPITRTCSEGGQ